MHIMGESNRKPWRDCTKRELRPLVKQVHRRLQDIPTFTEDGSEPFHEYYHLLKANKRVRSTNEPPYGQVQYTMDNKCPPAPDGLILKKGDREGLI